MTMEMCLQLLRDRKGNECIFAEYVAVCGLMLFQKGCITQHNAEFSSQM